MTSATQTDLMATNATSATQTDLVWDLRRPHYLMATSATQTDLIPTAATSATQTEHRRVRFSTEHGDWGDTDAANMATQALEVISPHPAIVFRWHRLFRLVLSIDAASGSRSCVPTPLWV